MSIRPPGSHPNQKPTANARIDWRHPLAQQLAGAWLIPDLFQSAPDGADAWHYRIANGVDDNYARVEGTVTSQVGPRGAVIGFPSVGGPGTAAYIVNAPGMNYSDPMSLFVRARIPSTGGWNWLVAKSTGSWLGINPSNKLSWTVTPGLDHLSSATVADGNWHTVGMTLGGGLLQLYIDGAPDNSFSGVTLSVTSADTFWGHNGNWTEFFRGEIEGVYQWRRALAPNEVRQLHNEPFAFYNHTRWARQYYLPGRNPAATGARVTEVLAEVAWPGAIPASSGRVTAVTAEVAWLAGTAADTLAPYGSPSGATQALLYRPGLPTGPTWSANYSPEFGQPAPETFTYDVIAAQIDARLVEDGDGIPPTGAVTADLSPSVAWTAPTGAVGPFLYSWTVQTSGVTGGVGPVLASGTVVNRAQVEIYPGLPVGAYTFALTGTTGTGGSVGMTALTFTLIDRRYLYPPVVVAIGPFDVEPVVPQDQDYVRYLPQWMGLHTATSSGQSLFRDFWSPQLAAFRTLSRQAKELLDAAAVPNVPGDLARLGWHLPTRFTPRDTPTITVTASGVSGAVRRALSLYDFLTARDPVFVIEQNGSAWLRNLCLRQVTVNPAGTGAVLGSQYPIPFEPAGCVADADLYFQSAGLWYRIRAGSPGVDPHQAVIQLTPDFTGPLPVQYLSRAAQATVTVSVSGSPALTPDRVDLWNRFDELALLTGLERRPDEDNLALAVRVRSRFLQRVGDDGRAVAQHVAQDLTLAPVLIWDAKTWLPFMDQGIFGVRAVEVRGLLETDSLSEELVAWGDGQRFTAAKSDWLPGWQLLLDGRPVGVGSYPALTVSGNVINFGAPVSGRVRATYRYRNYTPALSAAGFVSGLIPNTSAPSGSYRLVLTRNVRAVRATDPDYQQQFLLNADGSANGFFRELRRRLLDGSPVHVGRARWGEPGWLAAGDQKPAIAHMPIPFDQNG